MALTTLLTDVDIFDGKQGRLLEDMCVLVVDNKIEKIAKSISSSQKTQVIKGTGCVLMPGLIDTKTQMTMAAISFAALVNSEREYIGIVAANEAKRTLLRGFTTIRDMGGASFGIKQAIDEGQIIGPRIYPSGAAISQTSGHMDIRGR